MSGLRRVRAGLPGESGYRQIALDRPPDIKAVQPAPGHTAVVAQSGNMGNQLLAFAELQGIGIRGFCGSGNEGMITIEDYLDAFEVSPDGKRVAYGARAINEGGLQSIPKLAFPGGAA